MDESVKNELYERCKSEVARKYGLGTPKDAQRAIKILNMGNGITIL